MSMAIWFLFPIVKDELISIIMGLKNKRSVGSDEIYTSLIKRSVNFIVDVLLFIFNLSLECGVFPDQLKSAVVLPLFKKGDKTDPNNYRPISLLTIFSKILEKVMKTRLCCYLDKIKFFSSSQFGFRTNFSTEDALLKFLQIVQRSINRGNKSVALFVDITKAFDMVDHRILLDKLWHIGIRGNAYKWMRSYLSNRTQVVKLNSHFSEKLEIKYGVPQGSILGPLLFLIYINSIFGLEFCGSAVGFADDIAFAYSSVTTQDIETQMAHDLKLLRKWMNAHSMVLSIKTKAMFFDLTRNVEPSQPIVYHEMNCSARVCNTRCIIIENVYEFKYLGLNLDAKFNWKSHLQLVSLAKIVFFVVSDNFICYVIYAQNLCCGQSTSRLFNQKFNMD